VAHFVVINVLGPTVGVAFWTTLIMGVHIFNLLPSKHSQLFPLWVVTVHHVLPSMADTDQFHGRCLLDASLQIEFQIGFVLITMPYTFSQMGLAWGISACLLYGLLGAWTVYLLVWLYLEFKSRLDVQGKVRPKKYILQVQ